MAITIKNACIRLFTIITDWRPLIAFATLQVNILRQHSADSGLSVVDAVAESFEVVGAGDLVRIEGGADLKVIRQNRAAQDAVDFPALTPANFPQSSASVSTGAAPASLPLTLLLS